MSKGTKVIRFGRIQVIIEELKTERKFYQDLLENEGSEFPSYQYYHGQIIQINSIIHKLEALGE